MHHATPPPEKTDGTAMLMRVDAVFSPTCATPDGAAELPLPLAAYFLRHDMPPSAIRDARPERRLVNGSGTASITGVCTENRYLQT
jgi:hypothetical protein